MTRQAAEPVRVAVTYRNEWPDGLGARGWKLDVSVGEDAVIAATPETGARIPTSVLVHDILDHHLCGLGIGGHRNEAIALVQLGERTGADPRVDFAQIVEEDLLRGHVNKETMLSFLPEDLRRRVPAGVTEGKAIADWLIGRLGRQGLKDRLVEHFVEVGTRAAPAARAHFERLGLEYARRPEMGLALQKVFAEADRQVQAEGRPVAFAHFEIQSQTCALRMHALQTKVVQTSFACAAAPG